jgi:hypothetical protein
MIERFGPFEQPEPPHGLSSWVWTNPPEPPPADRWLDTGDVRTGVFNTAIESMAVGMAGKFDQWIAALPPGHRLCMHDEVKLSTDDFALDRDTVTFRLSQRGHHLEPGETCDYHGTRVEYGPRS